MSNFGKKYRKDPVKEFQREVERQFHPRKKRKQSIKSSVSFSKRRKKPEKISIKTFIFWLFLGLCYILFVK